MQTALPNGVAGRRVPSAVSDVSGAGAFACAVCRACAHLTLLLPLHTSGKISCISLSATATTAAASLAEASASFTLAPGIILRRFKGLLQESNTTTARTPLAVQPGLSGFHHASKAAITASRGTAG